MSDSSVPPEYTVPLREFAARIGRNPEVTRRKYGHLGRLRYGRLFFRDADIVRVQILIPDPADATEFSVSRTAVAKLMRVDPRTAASRMAKIGAEEGRTSTELMYRAEDVEIAIEVARENELVPEGEVASLLKLNRLQVRILHELPHFCEDGMRMPRPERFKNGQHQWRRGKIERWAAAFKADPEVHLKEFALQIIADASDPEAMMKSSRRPMRRIELMYESIIRRGEADWLK